MSLSIFLTIYFLFLIVYGALIGFAVYKVFLFAKNRAIKGYSRRITLVFMIVVLSVISISFLFIPRYHWNDNFGFYCKKIFNSCSCETDDSTKSECIANQKNEQAQASVNQSPSADLKNSNSENTKTGNGTTIKPKNFLFVN